MTDLYTYSIVRKNRETDRIRQRQREGEREREFIKQKNKALGLLGKMPADATSFNTAAGACIRGNRAELVPGIVLEMCKVLG